jgi:hypothetical protein
MEDYVEDFKYNNCFWKKSGVLYTHAKSKFKEYMSIGAILKSVSKAISNVCVAINETPSVYKKADDEGSTRSAGISVFFDYLKILNNKFHQMSKSINEIANLILEKNDKYESRKPATKMCDDYYKKYQDELLKLSQVKKVYFDAMNKTIEYYLLHKFSNKIGNNKVTAELKSKKNVAKNKKLEYKQQIENVEKCRVEYMEIQGNIFASEEELEKECTEELKNYFKKFGDILQKNFLNVEISKDQLDKIEAISGKTDSKNFAEKNKSLMTGPKRNLYKEYTQDLNYYMEHFDFMKSKLKGKTQKELRDLNHKISADINELIKDLIQEEPNQIHIRIEQIAKDIKENRASKADYEYLENHFQKRYDEFKRWKEEKVCDQDYRKVGKEWDERFCYMHTFLGYFNRTRVENKELNKVNFEYLSKAMTKILELNGNEDIDYTLCDLVVILASTFYMVDPDNQKGKIYLNEVIRKCSIMQKQGFWVGLTRFELNEEIQKQNKIEDTLKEDDITEEKLNNSVIAKLMSVSYNIIQFVMDSSLFNRILFDIFKYCKINAENRAIVVEMIDGQIQSEALTYLKLDRELLLSSTPDSSKNEKEEKPKVNTEKV